MSEAARDPVVSRALLQPMAEAYLAGGDVTLPLASPLYADLRGLPPLLIQAGRKEVLVEEAQRLAARAKAAGVETTVELYDERLHIFSLFPFLPNAARALEAIRAFLASRAGMTKAAE